MDMEDLDLNIDNYSLKDIFQLFQMDPILDEDALKIAKKIVLKTHPDKSGLDSKYFIFFSKAYKKLFGLYQFQNKSEKKSVYEGKDFHKNEKEKRTTLNKFFKTNNLEDKAAFNKWFNSEFEKNNANTLGDGYDDWLKSDEDIMNDDNIAGSNVNDKMINLKKQAVIKYDGIVSGLEANVGGGVILGEIHNYSSQLFGSGLAYNDLKDAHQNSIIGISEDIERQKFKNLHEYEQFRNKQDLKPLNESQAQQYFKNQEYNQNEESIQIAYKLNKEYEESKMKNELLWGKMQQIRE